MENEVPRGLRRELTDADLRQAVEQGLKPTVIAERFGVSRQAVYKRLRLLGLSTTAAVVAPEESKRFVNRTVDAMTELTRGLERTNLLQDACDAWLRDASDPNRYDIGARSGEIDVTYLVELHSGSGYRTEKRKKKLSELLAVLEGQDEDGARFVRVERGEYRHADPRELVLRTVQEVRQTVSTMADLARLLADARLMEAFREAVLTEIAKESPEVASRIAEAVQRSLVVCEAFRGPDALPAGRH